MYNPITNDFNVVPSIHCCQHVNTLSCWFRLTWICGYSRLKSTAPMINMGCIICILDVPVRDRHHVWHLVTLHHLLYWYRWPSVPYLLQYLLSYITRVVRRITANKREELLRMLGAQRADAEKQRCMEARRAASEYGSGAIKEKCVLKQQLLDKEQKLQDQMAL